MSTYLEQMRESTMKTLDPRTIELFYQPKDRLRMTIPGDRSYPIVKPAWAAPLSHPQRYLVLLDGKDQEITMIEDPASLSPEARAVVEEELRRRYLTATITAVEHAKVEFGATYWVVQTDRGRREFVTQSLQENAIWLSSRHLLLIDVDGNRFEIPDLSALDARSRRWIHMVV
jgi:hypothetical protein